MIENTFWAGENKQNKHCIRKKNANQVWPLLGGGAGSRWCRWTPALYWACSEGRRTRTPRIGAADASPGTSQHTPARPWPAARWLERESVKGNRSITPRHVASLHVFLVWRKSAKCQIRSKSSSVEWLVAQICIWNRATGTFVKGNAHTAGFSLTTTTTVRESCFSKMKSRNENSFTWRCCCRLQFKLWISSSCSLFYHFIFDLLDFVKRLFWNKAMATVKKTSRSWKKETLQCNSC